jgi:hypothetical protein
MVAVGVQMKPVVMPPPYRADLTGLLQHYDAKPGRAHRRGASEPRRARTDDDGVKGWRHASPILLASIPRGVWTSRRRYGPSN